MKAVVAAFNQAKALVGAFSVIVQPVVEPMEHFTALFRMLDEDNGGTIGFPEIQKVVIGTFQYLFLMLNRCCRLWICVMPRRLTSKFSGPSGSSTATTPSPSASMSSGTRSDKCGKYLTGWGTSIILVIVRR